MNELNIKAKQLSDLVQGLGVYSNDVCVSGICDDTRKLKAGDAFLCLPRAQNIEALIQQALDKKASAIIVVGEPKTKLDISCACLPDMQAVGHMLRRWFETESSLVPCVGITGTDGKTSVAWMLREVLEKHLGSAWSCGTLGWKLDAETSIDLGNTTPSLLALQRILARATREKIGALVLEVSSHGIAQERIAGIPFSAAVWTTMGRDHLEDHGSFEAYIGQKSSFVKSVADAGGTVVANADYDLVQQALSNVAGHVFWYAKGKQADVIWSVKSKDVVFADNSQEIELTQVPHADFHVENLAAVALLMKEKFGLSLSAFKSFETSITTPEGRLEPVDEQQNVWVDYAHTAEGLSRCLLSAKKLTQGQLLLVFGCGGNRDKEKRPEMGATAVAHANECWLTSDNPRDEKQSDIAADVLQGISKKQLSKVHVIEDRAVAIAQAIAQMGEQDGLVIAGKGHESYMEIKGNRLPWSDKTTALSALQARDVRKCA